MNYGLYYFIGGDRSDVYHDSRDLRGCHSLDLLYQGIESSSTRGELRPDDGTEYTAR